MIEETGLDGVEYITDELPVAILEETRRPSRTRKMVGLASLALLLIVAVIYLVPSLRQDFFPQARKARPARKASSPAEPGPPPAVPVVWERIDPGAMPAAVAENLGLGKYYYDRRQPGNFGLAIDHWKKALAALPEADRDGVQTLVESAELELARQFSSDSADAFVLLKQGKRDEAVTLLMKMRADYLDIKAPQYIWTSVMLSRRRR